MWLFDTEDFTPRNVCGNWPDWLMIAAIVSNLIIAIAYTLISLLLAHFWYKRHKTVPHSHILIFFVLFIFFCGLTHLIDACTFFWPVYRFLVFADVLTAIVSFVTVMYLPKVVLYFLEYKAPGEYKELANTLQIQLQLERQMSSDMERVMRMLEERARRIEREIQRKGWVDEQNLRLDELKETLEELKGKYNVPVVNDR